MKIAPTAHSTLSRRSFLKGGLATAAGTIFFPYIARSNPIGANNRVRMALVGCGGMMGAHHGWAQSHPMIDLVAVCDVKKSQRDAALAKLKQKNPDAVGYVDYGDIMARSDIDAVIISTPDHWHAAISIDAMRTGKDVYVEKPMALTLDEAAAMVVAEKRYGRILQVGSQQRSDPAMRQAVDIVRNGWIGEITEIFVDFKGDFAPVSLLPEEPNLDEPSREKLFKASTKLFYPNINAPAPNKKAYAKKVLAASRGRPDPRCRPAGHDII